MTVIVNLLSRWKCHLLRLDMTACNHRALQTLAWNDKEWSHTVFLVKTCKLWQFTFVYTWDMLVVVIFVFCDVLETCCLDVQTHCTFKRLQVSCVNLSQVSDGLNGDNFIGQMSFSLTSQSNSSASQCNCSSTVAHSFHSSLIGINLESVAHIETSWKLI